MKCIMIKKRTSVCKNLTGWLFNFKYFDRIVQLIYITLDSHFFQMFLFFVYNGIYIPVCPI